MQPPETPAEEQFRLAALHYLGLLDTPAERDFDDLVALAQVLFQVPIALISLIDRDRQWFKARAGFDGQEGPRATSFCGHAILAPEGLVVPDASRDPRFHDNPFVTGAPHIRFYAGAPLRLPSGYAIGTLCIIDRAPRPGFGPADQARLASLAGLVVELMGLRMLRAELDAQRLATDRHRALLAAANAPLALVDAAGRIEECSPAFAGLSAVQPPEGALLADALAGADPALDLAAIEVSATVSLGGVRLTIHRDIAGYAITN